MAFTILVDADVWLGLAKEYKDRALLDALELLAMNQELELILPQMLIDEFLRNKQRVVKEAGQSLVSNVRRVKEFVELNSPQKNKPAFLRHLNELDHQVPLLGERAVEAVGRIEALFAKTTIRPVTDAVRGRALQRGIEKKAPYLKGANSSADALLIELYGDVVNTEKYPRERYAFVTHNKNHFSYVGVDERLPHPDIASFFTKRRSLYSVKLGDILRKVNPDLMKDLANEQDSTLEPRRLSEITEAIDLLWDQVWYNRHHNMRYKIRKGTTKLVDKETFPVKDHEKRPVQRDVWEMALKAAARVEKKRGLDKLGPWNDFEWGMINGKLSALRWIMGDDWDMLDT